MDTEPTETQSVGPETVPNNNTLPVLRISKYSPEAKYFEELVESVPNFLSLTASKIKKEYPTFQKFQTSNINTVLQNWRKKKAKAAAAAAKDSNNNNSIGGKEKRNLTEQEKSKFYPCLGTLSFCEVFVICFVN